MRAPLYRIALVASLSLMARGAFAGEPPPAAWPPVHFTLDLVEAIAARDTIEWSAVPVAESETALREHVATLVRSELGTKYPRGFLRRELLAVHVVRELDGGGRAWGGLHWHQRVLLTTGPDDYIVAALHHEVAGLLLERHESAMSWTAWRQLSQPYQSAPGEFAFLPEARPGADASGDRVTSGLPEEFGEELAKLGHVTTYGRTTEANDLEEYLRLLLQRPGRMLECARRHDVVRAKLELALDFLGKVSEGAMSREFLAGWMASCGDPDLARDPKLIDVLKVKPQPR